MEYQIFTDATADLCPSLLEGLPPVTVIPMQVEIGEKEYTFGPGGNLTIQEFYALQKAGNFASTSQISPSEYFDSFEPCLRGGADILYLCFSSGLSGTFQTACMCAEELKEKYPGRRVLCVDTLCASVGEGFIVHEAARKQAEGLTMDELAEWVTERRLSVCHWFTVDTFEHLKHGGRVSAAAAAMGTVLNIKPLLHVDDNGRLEAKAKPRGRKKAIAAQVDKMAQGWSPELSKLVVIGHGDTPDAAEMLRQAVLDRFPDAEVHISDIGPVIGAHTGPGVLVLCYWGSSR